MKKILVLFPLFLTVACVSEELLQQSRIMERIERDVQLPTGSKNLRNYARYYSSDGQRVIGIYISIYSSHGDFDLAFGQRRWIKDREKLPMILDGGCSVIEVTYLPATRTIERVQCNGDA